MPGKLAGAVIEARSSEGLRGAGVHTPTTRAAPDSFPMRTPPYDRRVIDESTEFGARVARHLRDDIVVWLTTVTPAGAPLPAPVWFIWDGAETVTMFSAPGARVRNIEANPRVTLNFDGNGRGGDIVVIAGRATAERDAPSAAESETYLAKYDDHIERIGMTPATFAAHYEVPVRVSLARVRGH